MSEPAREGGGGRLVPVGRVGRAHGVDGSFYVEGADHPLPAGTEVTVAGRRAAIERRAGTDGRPLVRLAGVGDRDAAVALRGEALRLPEREAPLAQGEWLVSDLVGCRVEGVGEVRAVIAAPSCDLLEVGEQKVLVPLVGDAVRTIDIAGRRIEVDRRFLGLDGDGTSAG